MKVAWRAFKVAAVAAQALVVLVSLYQAAVTTSGYIRRKRGHLPATGNELPSFGLIVCARNEEAVVARIVRDLLGQEYPRELVEVVVVAHNCDDDTAGEAARAGASVIVLADRATGKSYPIQAGLEVLAHRCDFVGVFDADARVEPGLLKAIAERSGGEDCLQAEAVPIEDPEWLAAGYGFGRKARNMFWWRPREALGLGTTITGCGWFIRPEVFREVFPNARTLTEDLELTASLYATGHKVAYVSAARVAIGEPREFKSSVRQRTRWVRGHLNVVRMRWPALAWRAANGDRRALDMAIYMVMPTRLLTRTGVTGAIGLTLLRAPFALPWFVVVPAVFGEWAVPAFIAWKERLVGANRTGLELAVRHGVLSLMWFPIGVWALVTARVNVWEAMPRPFQKDHSNVQ